MKDEISPELKIKSDEEIHLRGTPVSEGIAIGVPFFPSLPDEESIPEFPIQIGEVDKEISRYREALFSSRQDLQKIQSDLESEGSLDAIPVIDAHIQMLEDPMMTTDMEKRIRDMRQNTETLFRTAIKEYEKKFSSIKSSFFQQRFIDVKDLSKRILNHLCHQTRKLIAEIPPHSIIVAKELIPSYAAAVQASQVDAFVTQFGGGNSHVALIARSKGIPYVVSVDVAMIQERAPKNMIVDGQTGEIILNPLPQTIFRFEEKKRRIAENYEELEKEVALDAETKDGHLFEVFANIGSLSEADLLVPSGASGIGLFRSEYLFLQNPSFFESEEEQLFVYEQLVEKAAGRPVTIRVLDLGGDKNQIHLAENQKEENPVLGCRGIRWLLRRKAIFKTQLRAILRAARHGDLRILLPLVSDIGELRQTKILLEEVKEELLAEKKEMRADVLLGCMVEVPSAVLIADALAAESDFLSIGTNDLVQYILGVDRSNPIMSDFCFPAHPSVLKMIQMAVLEAKRHHRSIAICGEIASNPLFVPLLLGLGIEEFSCAPRYVPLIKRAIRECSLAESQELATNILRLRTAEEVTHFLSSALRETT